MANRKWKVVEVDWFDAQSSTEPMTIDEMEQHLVPLFSQSVGYLIIEKKDYIVLGFLDFGNGLIKHHQVIPKGMIEKIRVVRNGKRMVRARGKGKKKQRKTKC